MILASAIVVVGVAAAPCYHCRRGNLVCGIPKRDYQYRESPPSIRAISESALRLTGTDRLELAQPPSAAQSQWRRLPGEVKLFQFVDDPVLRIDHCVLSNIAVLINERGEWSFSCRAYKNPLPPLQSSDPLPTLGPLVTTAERDRSHSDHLLRNQFVVQLHCYGETTSFTTSSVVGQPLITPIKPQPFWVQRHRPETEWQRGRCSRIALYYEAIDRVEIEFTYRYEHSRVRNN